MAVLAEVVYAGADCRYGGISAGHEPEGCDGYGGLMQYYPPVDLYNERLKELAKKLGPGALSELPAGGPLYHRQS
ncbi:MAG: hypothetical protein Q4C61_02935 [Lachnospiraceae bacterium]|nr:hypothetical protein [Lachnospiraceae bacterium]